MQFYLNPIVLSSELQLKKNIVNKLFLLLINEVYFFKISLQIFNASSIELIFLINNESLFCFSTN